MEQIPLDPEVLGPERTPPNNGNGRPRGARNLKHRALERAARAEALPILQKLIQMAKDGDTLAARIIFDRIWPRPRTALIALDIPATANAADVRAAMHTLLGRVASGDIPPDAGAALMQTMRDVITAYHVQTFDDTPDVESEETNTRELIATRLMRAIEERNRKRITAPENKNGGE